MADPITLLFVGLVEHLMPIAGGACCLWYAVDENFGLGDGEEENVDGKGDDDGSATKEVGHETWPRAEAVAWSEEKNLGEKGDDDSTIKKEVVHETWGRAEAAAWSPKGGADDGTRLASVLEDEDLLICGPTGRR